MDYLTFSEYVKSRKAECSQYIATIEDILIRSGFTSCEVFTTPAGKLVLMDLSKNIYAGIVEANREISDFKNSSDYASVLVDAYARYEILKRVTDNEDRKVLKELFKDKRTWVIHGIQDGDKFEAHTHGLNVYDHPEFRLTKNVGKEKAAYLLNSFGKSVQKGNAFQDGDVIESLYDNCKVVLADSKHGFFDIDFVAK